MRRFVIRNLKSHKWVFVALVIGCVVSYAYMESVEAETRKHATYQVSPRAVYDEVQVRKITDIDDTTYTIELKENSQLKNLEVDTMFLESGSDFSCPGCINADPKNAEQMNIDPDKIQIRVESGCGSEGIKSVGETGSVDCVTVRHNP